MSTTITPPESAPPAGGAPAQRPSSGARTVAILAIVLGVLVLLGTLVSAALTTVASAAVHTSSRTVAVAGVNELAVRVSAGSLRVEFGSVREAELEVTSSWGADRWTFERTGDRLVVGTPDRFGQWFGDWFSWGEQHGEGRAVLRLPSSLAGADAGLSLAAGDLTVDGDFGDLRLNISAGGLMVSGSAETLTADVSAGKGEVDLADVASATLSVSAGGLDATFTGEQPRSIEADVSAGSLQLEVPEGQYRVTSDVSAGGFDNRIGSDVNASSRIHVEVSAGEAVLRSAR
ncbi:hypothetical protein [Ruicaihuangia caeni]|uniref:Adhesin domain-containing protein n=1 Tax=Ruicaihuangia caeni TaxID=3042517 RepID=A0AAW6T9K5_9MICO|nr:hypothetical protein [Klugiella sp. YN-L-19]MDI2099013.1 hypothetical protein [Klugiella sp. YN-L-19]